MGERIPPVRSAGGRRQRRILREKPIDGVSVADDGRGVNILARDLRVRREDRIGRVERARRVAALARRAGGFDECNASVVGHG